VLGTAGYMSPEQVRGEPIDHRADIFAFGAVCYEIFTGRRAFVGGSPAAIREAILSLDPPALPAGAVPAPVERLVRRCLEKSPGQRFQSARDVAFALEAMSVATEASPPPAGPLPGRRAWGSIGLAVGVAAGAVIGAIVARPVSAPAPGVVSFEAKTFDRMPITNARFMPDGRTIVYSAAARGYTPGLFVLSPNSEAPAALGVGEAHLLAVSSKGELALILGARHLGQRLYGGTLARMTVGSSARAFLENVREADWSPDGAALAVVRDLGAGRDRLEYPVGKVLHEANGYLSDPRVSPDGKRVAFFEHPWRFDDRGWLKVVNQAGEVKTLAGELFGLQGMAWLPDGSKVAFSGNAAGGSVLEPMSVAASGQTPAQPAFGVPGRFIVYDVAPDGRWLGVREDLSLGVRAKAAADEVERDLSWLGSVGARGLSADGRWLLMVDVGPRTDGDYGVVLRSTDGPQVLRLGEGIAQKLSPDGRWAAAITVAPPEVVIYPIGPGEAIRIADARIDHFISADWFPDGRQLLVCGSAATRAPRCYRQDLTGSPPVAVTAEGVLATLAPDGHTLLLTLAGGGFQLASLEGGPPRAVAGLRADDQHIAWSRDSRAVYVQQGGGVPATVERVELATGQRSVVRRLAPEGTGAVAFVSVADWVEDRGWYAYNYTSLPSTLFVVSRAIH
jgi:Tol biopolymer transport system component